MEDEDCWNCVSSIVGCGDWRLGDGNLAGAMEAWRIVCNVKRYCFCRNDGSLGMVAEFTLHEQ